MTFPPLSKPSFSNTVDIITGPPGAGKLLHVFRTQRTSPIYCCYHHNKKYAPEAPHPHIVLLAYSSSKFAKDYWMRQAVIWERTPTLYVIKPTQEEALTRMHRRPRDNELDQEIYYWFRTYTPHPDEIELTVAPGDEDVYT